MSENKKEVNSTQQIVTNNEIELENQQQTVAEDMSVTISDKATAPIVVLLGAPGEGKTVLLHTLTHYLRMEKSYTVEVVKNFRRDSGYKEVINSFADVQDALKSKNVPKRNSSEEFMLVEVRNSREEVLYQILEAPGEHYINKETQEVKLSDYLLDIIDSERKKIWMVLKSPVNDYSKGYRTLLDEIIKANRQQVAGSESIPVSKDLEKINEKNKYLFVLTKSDTVSAAEKNAPLESFFPIIDDIDNAADFPEFYKDTLTKKHALKCDVLSYYGGSFKKTRKEGTTHWTLEAEYKRYAKNLWTILTNL